MESPCKNCPERGCGIKHDTCDKYAAYAKARADVNRELTEIHRLDRHALFEDRARKKRKPR